MSKNMSYFVFLSLACVAYLVREGVAFLFRAALDSGPPTWGHPHIWDHRHVSLYLACWLRWFLIFSSILIFNSNPPDRHLCPSWDYTYFAPCHTVSGNLTIFFNDANKKGIQIDMIILYIYFININIFTWLTVAFLFYLFCFCMLGMEPRSWHMLGKRATTEIYSQCDTLINNKFIFVNMERKDLKY
jgi:hypothetical protein